MYQLTTAPSATNATGAFEVTLDCTVIADVLTTLGGGTLILQHSRDKGANWVATAINGTAPTITTLGIFNWSLAGGRYYRFLNVAATTATTVWVSGPHINANVFDPSATH